MFHQLKIHFLSSENHDYYSHSNKTPNGKKISTQKHNDSYPIDRKNEDTHYRWTVPFFPSPSNEVTSIELNDVCQHLAKVDGYDRT